MTMQHSGKQRSPSLSEGCRNQLDQSIRLTTSQETIQRAVFAVLFCVATDAISLMCITPNFPLMVAPGAHPDSFPPFGIKVSTAQYLVLSLIGLATVFSSFFFSWLGDRYNSRLAILILMAGTVVTTIARYFSKPSYWSFLATSVIASLFGGSVGTTSGYMAKLFHQDQSKVDAHVSYVMATMVVFRSLGGLLTVLFPGALFLPLIPAGVLSLLAFSVAYVFVLDPPGKVEEKHTIVEDFTDDMRPNNLPENIHVPTMVNIVLGSISDCVGSTGLTAFAFSPLLFKTFYLDFVDAEQNPIMSENEYRALYSLLAIAAVPGALAAPLLFQKFGIVLVCVGANLLTGLTIIAIIFIAQLDPTKGTYVVYACVIYISFPLTLISNLTTGPMLDRITPFKNKGFMQGVNVGIFEGTQSVFTFLLGSLSDRSMFATMWICVGFSFLAVFINAPLIRNPRLRDMTKSDSCSKISLQIEEEGF